MRIALFLALVVGLSGCDRAQPTPESVNPMPTASAPVPLRGPVEGGVSTVAEVPKSSCGGACGVAMTLDRSASTGCSTTEKPRPRR